MFRFLPLFVILTLAAILVPLSTAQAAGLVVNGTNDVNDGTCNVIHYSLCEAITTAPATLPSEWYVTAIVARQTYFPLSTEFSQCI